MKRTPMRLTEKGLVRVTVTVRIDDAERIKEIAADMRNGFAY